MSSKLPQPEVQVIKLHKNSNGMGLSIVAAKGAGQVSLFFNNKLNSHYNFFFFIFSISTGTFGYLYKICSAGWCCRC